jgi:hypothetical protein
MNEIIKYQLKGRKNTILFMLAIFAIINVVAWIAEVYGFTSWTHTVSSGVSSFDFNFESSGSGVAPLLGFWVPIALATTVIATVVMFFMCCSGHVNELLFRDTSYLMLTVPRRGREIIGGRLIAGFAEFLMYAVPALFILSVHGAIAGVYATNGQTGFFEAFAYLYKQVFFVNVGTTLKLALIGTMLAAATGMFIMFAAIASRSFIKTKKLATAIAIAVFIVVTNWTVKIGDAVSARLDWYIRIPIEIEGRPFQPGWIPGEAGTQALQTCSVPFAPIVIFFAIAIGLFVAASWLMEKKVEL